MKNKPNCLIENCLTIQYSRGLCKQHYMIIWNNNQKRWAEFEKFGMALPKQKHE
jgi:hypothetical protein